MREKIFSILLMGAVAIGTAGNGDLSGATVMAAVKTGDFDKSETIEETVLIDQDDIKVTATELTFTNYSADVAISIENNSSKDLNFISGSLGYSCNSVNGYMMDEGYINEDVAAGKKTKTTASFSLEELQAYGIYSIADIQLGIYTTDDNFNETDYEPKKIITSGAASYDYETDTYKKSIEEGTLEELVNCKVEYWNTDQLYSQNGISIDSVALITNKDGEQSFFIEFANASEQIVKARISSIAINNLVLEGGTWSADMISPEKKEISNIRLKNLLDEEYQDLINVGGVSTLSFDLTLENVDGVDITSEQTVTVNLSENPSFYEVSGTPILESNGIKLTELGIVKEEKNYSYDGYHIFYAVENETQALVYAECDYDSLSINDYMIDFYDFSGATPAGMTGLLRIDLHRDDAEEAGITSVEDITKIEFLFKVKDNNYNKIVEETIVSEK